MTLNLSKKNVPSVMAMTLGMVSMIATGASAITFVKVIGDYQYTCNTDINKNPLTDCFNSMDKICNTTNPTWDSAKKINCHTVLNSMFDGMNSDWKKVRKECGQWPFTQNGINYTGNYLSDNCKNANDNLRSKGFYTGTNGVKVPVTSGLTESLGLRIWGNPVLKDIVRYNPDCYYVIESWKKMGKTTDVSSTSSTACCKALVYSNGTIRTQTSGIPGVNCNSTGIVTAINWKLRGLTGAIPPEIGYLTNLLKLDLSSNNQLAGNVPSSLGDLSDLEKLDLSKNSLLNGTFRASCQTTALNVSNTRIIPCGCLAGSTPANGFPPPLTPDECLAERVKSLGVSSGLKLKKRTLTTSLVYSENIGEYYYACRVDQNQNPMQDCMNLIAKICYGSNKIKCRSVVDKTFDGLNSHWKNVRRACGKWQWQGLNDGNPSSTACATANKDLKEQAKYITNANTVSSIDDSVTESMKQIWDNFQ